MTAKPNRDAEPTVPRRVQVSDTKRDPKSPKFPPKIGLLRWTFDIHLPDTLHTPTFASTAGPANLNAFTTFFVEFCQFLFNWELVVGVFCSPAPDPSLVEGRKVSGRWG